MRVRQVLMIGAVAALIPFAALAQGTNVAFGTVDHETDAPVEVTADRLSVDQSDNTAVFEGNVLVGQGDLRLSAPEVRVLYTDDGNGIALLQARGGVTLVSGEDAAEASEADYDIDSGFVDMRGDVLLTRGRSAVASDEARIDLEGGTAVMQGRVKTVLQSGDQ